MRELDRPVGPGEGIDGEDARPEEQAAGHAAQRAPRAMRCSAPPRMPPAMATTLMARYEGLLVPRAQPATAPRTSGPPITESTLSQSGRSARSGGSSGCTIAPLYNSGARGAASPIARHRSRDSSMIRSASSRERQPWTSTTLPSGIL